MARQRLALLRRAIARIEGRPAETLDGTHGRAAAGSGAGSIHSAAGGLTPVNVLHPHGSRIAAAPEASSLRGDEAVDASSMSSPRSLPPGIGPISRPSGKAIFGNGWAVGTSRVMTSAGRIHPLNLIQTGAASFDAALGGGLQAAALTELRTDETRHAAALFGFALCLAVTIRPDAPLLWLSADASGRETGLPYLPGICGLAGVAPGSLFTGLGRTVHDTLWIAEEAAASGAFAAVILELRGNLKALGLDQTRRLQRRATLSGRPLLLLRVAGVAEPTAAPVRLAIAPAPSVPRRTRDGPLEGSIGAPAFRVAVEKARAPSHHPFVLEWNPNELLFTGRQADSLPRPAASADRPDRPPALGPRVASARTA